MHYFWNLHKVCHSRTSADEGAPAERRVNAAKSTSTVHTLGCLSNDAKFCIVFDVVPCIIAPYLTVPDEDKQQDSQSIAI
jgi:hypothetical protein